MGGQRSSPKSRSATTFWHADDKKQGDARENALLYDAGREFQSFTVGHGCHSDLTGAVAARAGSRADRLGIRRGS